MKKINLLISILIIGLFLSSCSNSDNNNFERETYLIKEIKDIQFSPKIVGGATVLSCYDKYGESLGINVNGNYSHIDEFGNYYPCYGMNNRQTIDRCIFNGGSIIYYENYSKYSEYYSGGIDICDYSGLTWNNINTPSSKSSNNIGWSKRKR